MPGPGKNNQLNKEIIREFDGKYANGGAGFFVNQIAFDVGAVLDMFYPDTYGENARGERVKKTYSEVLSDYGQSAIMTAPLHPVPVSGDASSLSKSRILHQDGADARGLNKAFEIHKDGTKKAREFMDGLSGPAEAFKPYFRLVLRHMDEGQDYVQGYMDNPYLYTISGNLTGGGPKMLPLTEDGKTVMKDGKPVIDFEGMKAVLQGTEDDPGPLKPFMDLVNATNDLWDLEYERQAHLRNGSTRAQEKEYLDKLTKAADTLDTAFKNAGKFEEDHPGQWGTEYLNNAFAHIVDHDRDIRSGVGHVMGQKQAAANGYGMHELPMLGFIGELDAVLPVKSREAQKNLESAQADYNRLANDPNAGGAAVQAARENLERCLLTRNNYDAIREDFDALKADVWNKKVSTAEEKLEVFNKIQKFRQDHRGLRIGSSTFADFCTGTDAHFAQIGERLNDPVPDKTANELSAERLEKIRGAGAEAQQQLQELRAANEEEFADYDPYPEDQDPEAEANPDRNGRYFAFREKEARYERRVLHGKLAEDLDHVTDMRETANFFDRLIDKYDLTLEEGELKIGVKNDPYPETLGTRLRGEILRHSYENLQKNMITDLRDVGAQEKTPEQLKEAAAEYIWNGFAADMGRRQAETGAAEDLAAKREAMMPAVRSYVDNMDFAGLNAGDLAAILETGREGLVDAARNISAVSEREAFRNGDNFSGPYMDDQIAALDRADRGVLFSTDEYKNIVRDLKDLNRDIKAADGTWRTTGNYKNETYDARDFERRELDLINRMQAYIDRKTEGLRTRRSSTARNRRDTMQQAMDRLKQRYEKDKAAPDLSREQVDELRTYETYLDNRKNAYGMNQREAGAVNDTQKVFDTVDKNERYVRNQNADRLVEQVVERGLKKNDPEVEETMARLTVSVAKLLRYRDMSINDRVTREEINSVHDIGRDFLRTPFGHQLREELWKDFTAEGKTVLQRKDAFKAPGFTGARDRALSTTFQKLEKDYMRSISNNLSEDEVQRRRTAFHDFLNTAGEFGAKEYENKGLKTENKINNYKTQVSIQNGLKALAKPGPDNEPGTPSVQEMSGHLAKLIALKTIEKADQSPAGHTVTEEELGAQTEIIKASPAFKELQKKDPADLYRYGTEPATGNLMNSFMVAGEAVRNRELQNQEGPAEMNRNLQQGQPEHRLNGNGGPNFQK